MWKTIRENAGLTQTDIGNVFGITRQAISQFEHGRMPLNVQAYYLKLRGLEVDLAIADYLLKKYEEKGVKK